MLHILWLEPSFAQKPELAYPSLILKNAKIYTDKTTGRQWSQALSIRGDILYSIGSNTEILKEKGPTTKVLDLKGRIVLPGFNDAHAHFFTGGLSLLRLDLTGVKSLQQFQERLKKYAQANPLKRWILGSGWDHTAWDQQKAQQKYPVKEDLDVVVNDRPVLLWHVDHHYFVLNSKALEMLQIPSNTGLIFENAAYELAAKVDIPSLDELRQAFHAAQDLALQYGVTSIQGGPIDNENEIKILEEMANSKQLHVRFALWGHLEKPDEFQILKEKYKHLPENLVKFAALKGFVDGVISSRTAALLEPYSDDLNTKGNPNYTQEKLNELVLQANRKGFQVCLHAIGDKAASLAVTSFANSKKQLFNSRIRNKIEHLEVVTAPLFKSFADFNIVASGQPSHMIYDKESENYNLARLGQKRVVHAFAWKKFITNDAHIAFGTDWPVMPLNPMEGLFGAVFRQNYNGKPARGWYPENKITMEQALLAYTLGSAYATHEEHIKGSIREGKFADLVVLDQDPFKAKGVALLKIPVYLTITGGQIVYDSTIPKVKAAQN